MKLKLEKTSGGIYRAYIGYHRWGYIIRTQPGPKWFMLVCAVKAEKLTDLAGKLEKLPLDWTRSLKSAIDIMQANNDPYRALPDMLTFPTAVTADGQRIAFKLGLSELAPHYRVSVFDASDDQLTCGPVTALSINVAASHEEALQLALEAHGATMTDITPLDIRAQREREKRITKHLDVYCAIQHTIDNESDADRKQALHKALVLLGMLSE